MSGTEDDENVSKGSEQNKLEKVKEEEERPKEHKVTDDDSQIEDSPVMGLLSAKESANSETQDDANEKIPTEDMIKEALWKKAAYFRSKSEYVNLLSYFTFFSHFANYMSRHLT